MAKNVAQFMLERLNEWGVKRIYGYPGDGVNAMLGAFHEVEAASSSSRRPTRNWRLSRPLPTPNSPTRWGCAWPPPVPVPSIS